jgi:ferric-dicitrate binding protein FerR (iron transport regulator)
MNYYQFNAEDFAADDYFKEWVCAPSPETETFWRDFLKECPERYYQIEEARRLVMGLHEIQQPVSIDSVDMIWNRIQNTIDQSRIDPWSPQINWRRVWAVAATLFLVLGTGWFGYSRFEIPFLGSSGQSPQRNGWVETLNEASDVMQLQLPDGSRVDLQKGSRLRYRKEMTGPLREVTLTGEAFFNVRKNPHKPFVVYANGLVTKVLGTSFLIKAWADAPTVTVAVSTGRVSVYSNPSEKVNDPESKGMVLTPNQEVVFQRDVATLSKTLVDSPKLVLPPAETQSFEFEDASVARVFESIGKAYGVDVIYDEEVMQHCTLTLSLEQEDLFQKLDVICKVLDATYKVINAQVVIYSRGCPEQRLLLNL